MASRRQPAKAGSWYSADPKQLQQELETWLDAVSASNEGAEILPVAGARMIVAPHAGYAYSGPTAAWAYRALDLSSAKRIFLLGPSHAWSLSTCALSGFRVWGTPLGDVPIDLEVVAALEATGKFETMPASVDENEHSMELHLPYIYEMIRRSGRPITLVPIMVGHTQARVEKDYGSLLAPYLNDPENAFVISSDFAHWGQRFQYTYYCSDLRNVDSGQMLRRSDATPTNPAIHESIEAVDRASIQHIEAGDHDAFVQHLRVTGNTVCGRHPIGVMLAARQALVHQGKNVSEPAFHFTQYTRSSDCYTLRDSSVSYASGYSTV